jgi:hypothetical protein
MTTMHRAIIGWTAVLAVAGASLLIAAGEGDAGRGPSRWLAAAPLRWLGDRSYGWYLWHVPLIVWARQLSGTSSWIPTTVAAAAALAPAALSYRYVENPIRRNRSLTGPRVLALAGVCAIASLGALLAGGRLSDMLNHTASAARMSHLDLTSGCRGSGSLGHNAASCTFAHRGDSGTIVLVGDSNAGQFTEPLAAIAKSLHLRLMLAVQNGCPFVPVTRVEPSANTQGCSAFVSGSVRELERLHPAVAVVASRSSSYIEDGTAFAAPSGAGATTDPDRKAKLWESGLSNLLQELGRAGIRVIVVHPVPQIAGWNMDACSPLTLALDACHASRSRAAAERERARALWAEDAALRTSPGALGVDFANELCPKGVCSSLDRGQWLYSDKDHLSVDGALRLEAPLQRAIEEALGRAGG